MTGMYIKIPKVTMDIFFTILKSCTSIFIDKLILQILNLICINMETRIEYATQKENNISGIPNSYVSNLIKNAVMAPPFAKNMYLIESLIYSD